MAVGDPANERYTHGHPPVVVAAHARRSAANSAAFLLPHLVAGWRVLDVGCGPGTITVDLAEHVAPGEVIGVDRATAVLDQARAHAAGRNVRNVRFEEASAYELPFSDGTFDVVYAHQVLQHLAEPVRALREMARVLRHGGLVAVRDSDYGTMTHAPHDPRLDRWLQLYHDVAKSNGGEADAGRYLLGWVLQAGFENVTPSASTWWYATPDDRTHWGELWAARTLDAAFADRALDAGLSTRDELAAIADAWRAWAAKADGWFAFVHGEILAVR